MGGGEYIYCYVSSDDFFYPMTTNRTRTGGYVMEHRLVVAKAIGRCLLPWEIIHHKGVKYTGTKNRQDNRYPENLELLAGRVEHAPYNILQQQMKRLQKENDELRNMLREIKR